MHIVNNVFSRSKQAVRNIHAPFQPFLPEKAHGYCVQAFAVAVSAVVSTLITPAHALTEADLQPAVRDALKSHAFTKPGAPMPAFSWTLEKSRTLRRTHTVTENFSASASGVATVKVSDQRGSDAPSVRTRMSLRALEYVDADDAEVSVSAQDVDIPPKSGDTFTLTIKKDGQSLTKTCKVGERSAAASLFAALPGEMAAIECAGNGTYRGSQVKTKTQMAWFDALGVFLLLREEADTALGKFTETVKIKQFSK
ncbi:MAG: hypothetical protein RL341_91 [Pseudomonadota bacterium]|jgi:hypothetical protein